jgi:thioredoxin 1
MGVIHVTEKNYEEEILGSSLPVLVDFWAEWCGPCLMVGPIIEEIASELNGKLKVVKVNVDEAQELAAKYNIMSIPTLMIFKQGQVVEQMIGAMPKGQLLAKINSSLDH